MTHPFSERLLGEPKRRSRDHFVVMADLNYRRRWEDDDMTYHNMRYGKFGPNGGAWQEHRVSLVAIPYAHCLSGPRVR